MFTVTVAPLPAPGTPTTFGERSDPAEEKALKKPPPPPIDWARIPCAPAPLVVIAPWDVSATAPASPPPPPLAPKLTGPAAETPKACAAPPPPPIDCARMPRAPAPLVSIALRLVKVTADPAPLTPAAPR